MRIIVLCNTSSTDPISFFSPLTYQGLTEADNLVTILKKKNIDKIYCSPFLKTMQTIYPFCVETDKKIKVEPAFHDVQKIKDIIALGEFYNRRFSFLIGYEYLSEIFSQFYKVKYFQNNIQFEESKQDVVNRLYPVLYTICEKYRNSDRQILIVTHSKISEHIKRFFGASNIKNERLYEIEINSSWSSHIS